MSSIHLLITQYGGYALFLYGDDSSQLNNIKLPCHMIATHSVETTHKTYIVSHRYRHFNDIGQLKFKGVSEVDVNGRVVRIGLFNSDKIDSVLFNRSQHLVLDGNSHVIGSMSTLFYWIKNGFLISATGHQQRLCLSKSTVTPITSSELSCHQCLVYIMKSFRNNSLLY